MRISQLLLLSLFLLSAIEAQTSSDLDSIDFEYNILDPDSQSTVLAAEKSANIDYLSLGYDIFSGNPHSTSGVDPGFKSRIFNLTYNRQSKSTDGAWEIPDSTNMAKIDSCSLNFKSTEIDNMASYSDSLAIEVTISGGVSGIASFKASTDYKSAEKTLSTNNDKFIYSDANCDVYRAYIGVYDPPNLHSEFILALESLPAIYNQDEYFQFLDYFGTHAVSEIFMGARFGMMSRISQETYDKLTSQGITVTAAASFNLFGASGGVDTRTSNQKEIANKYSSAITEKHIISVGAKPVKDGDGVAWAQQAIQSPMPLRYKLIPISEIVTAKYVRGAIPAGHMNSVKTNIKTAFENYCKNYLVPQGLLANCDQPSKSSPRPPPQTKPPKINSCRWCANRCGGEFSVDGGHLLADREWPKWAFDYPPGCNGNLGNQEIQKGVVFTCAVSLLTQKGKDSAESARLVEENSLKLWEIH